MAHRDALEAALARVAALESQIADFGRSGNEHAAELARLREERDEYATKARALEVLLDRWTKAAQNPSSGLESLYDHNRRFAPLDLSSDAGSRTERARVACPSCASAGASVELYKGAGGFHIAKVLAPVLCPRCGFTGHIRIA